MSLVFTEEQELIRQTVREFAEEEVRPRVADMVKTNQFPRDLYKRCGDLGFWRLVVPEDLGGAGKGLTEACIVMEELARVSPALSLSLSVEIGLVSLPALIKTPAVKYAEGLMSGDIVIGAGSTDPKGQSNSEEWDVFARRDGNEWVLNGTRLYVTNGGACDLFSVSGLDEDRKMRKFYVMKKDVTGFDNSQVDWKYGMAGTAGGTIVLKDCRVPEEMTSLFKIGTSAYYYYVYCLCAAEALGCMEGLWEETVEFTKMRTHDFKPIASMQAVSHKLVQMKLKMEMARSLIYDATTMYDEYLADGSTERLNEWSIKAGAAKICVSELAADITTECLILHGGLGYHSPELHHFVGDALDYCIMDRTNEIHLDDIAKTLGITG